MRRRLAKLSGNVLKGRLVGVSSRGDVTGSGHHLRLVGWETEWPEVCGHPLLSLRWSFKTAGRFQLGARSMKSWSDWISTNLRYFTWVFPLHAASYFDSTKVHLKRQILYFLLHYICLTALVTSDYNHTQTHASPNLEMHGLNWSVPLRASSNKKKINKLFKTPLDYLENASSHSWKQAVFLSSRKVDFLEIRCSHRTATLQTYDDLVDHDALQYIKWLKLAQLWTSTVKCNIHIRAAVILIQKHQI